MFFRNPEALKTFTKKTDNIGYAFAHMAVGDITQADLDDMIGTDSLRADLQAAFRAASDRVGEAKALKTAVGNVRAIVDAYLGVSGFTSPARTQVQDMAEAALYTMLGR